MKKARSDPGFSFNRRGVDGAVARYNTFFFGEALCSFSRSVAESFGTRTPWYLTPYEKLTPLLFGFLLQFLSSYLVALFICVKFA